MSLEEQLFDAVLQSNIGEAIQYISLGANINAKNRNGNTLIHIATLCRDAFMVRTLAKLKANMNIKNSIGFTPISVAILGNDLNMVKTLLYLGAKHNVGDGNGNLPIHLAVQRGYQDIVEFLLKGDSINTYNHNGLIPLHLAVLNGHTNIVKILIEYCHTEIDMQDNKDENTALIFAVQKDNLDIVRLLLKHKADFSKRNKEGKTFNEFAISDKMKSIVSKYGKLLSKLNSDPTQSISPKPLVRKRKKSSSTTSENSSRNSDSRFLMFKRKKCKDQPNTSVASSMCKHKRFSDISNINLSQSESSEDTFEVSSNGSSINSHKSSLPESLIYRFERCFTESDSPEPDLSEPCTSQNAKRMRF